MAQIFHWCFSRYFAVDVEIMCVIPKKIPKKNFPKKFQKKFPKKNFQKKFTKKFSQKKIFPKNFKLLV